MFGFNWVDLIIAGLLVLAVVEGLRIGFATQLLVVGGFFGGLFAAGWLVPHLLPLHAGTFKTLVNGGLVLTISAYIAVRCIDVGQNIHWSFRLGKHVGARKLKWLETALGSILGIASGLVLVWLLGVAIGRLPFEGFSNSVSDSRVVQQLARTLPPVPAVFAWFDRQVDPNALPAVAAPVKPNATFNYAAGDVASAQAKAGISVVRITSFSCGGIVSGTGFVVGSGLVATNAHVIAGAKRSIVKLGGTSFETTPVYFDPNLDVAMLRVPKLPAPSLALAPQNVPLSSTVAVLGYPGGNYSVRPGLIRDTRATAGTSIYDQGSFGRGIYDLQASVDYGNSGSPIVLASGQVAGMVFSKSTTSPDTAYALSSVHLASALKQLGTSTTRVSTRACMVQ